MSLVRHSSSKRGFKRTWTPDSRLSLSRTNLTPTFRSLGGAAYGPKGYVAGAVADFAANRIKRAYTNYRAKSGKMFSTYMPHKQMRLNRFQTPRFDVGTKGKSSSSRGSTKKQSLGMKVSRKDLLTIKNVIMPSYKAIEYNNSGSISWAPGKQDVRHLGNTLLGSFTSAVMDRLFFKGRDLMSNAWNVAGVSNVTSDFYDRQMQMQIVHAYINVQLVNMCNHDLSITKYVWVCKKACSITPEDLWKTDLALGITIQADVVTPTANGDASQWGLTPKNSGLILLHKYWKLREVKHIKLEVGSQHRDRTVQSPGFYKGTQWRNPKDLEAVETILTANTNTTYWPGMVLPMWVSKATDFVVATAGTVTTPGSGKFMYTADLDYIIRVPPPTQSVSFGRVDYPTGLVGEVNYNPETEATHTYTTAGA